MITETNMGTKDKLIERFKKQPMDFTFEESVSLFSYFGYKIHHKGSSSGSRIRFFNEKTGAFINLHRPHPGSIMKGWMMKEMLTHLKNNGLI